MTNPEVDILFKIRSLHKPGGLGKLMTVIGKEGGLFDDIKIPSVGKSCLLWKGKLLFMGSLWVYVTEAYLAENKS